MAEFKVTSTELKNKASELRQLNNQFRSEVSEMTTQEQQLVGMWDGEAKEKFHDAYNRDKVQMDEFYNTIEKYCQALETNSANYDTAEKKNVGTATSRSYK